MKTRRLMLAAALTLGLALSSQAGKCGGEGRRGGGHHGGPGGPGKIMKLLPELDLSDSQLEAIGDIMKADRDARKSDRGKGREIHEEMIELALSDNYDAEQAAALADEAAALHKETTSNMIQTLHKISQQLTPAQKQELKEKMAEHEQNREEKRNRMKKFRSKLRMEDDE